MTVRTATATMLAAFLAAVIAHSATQTPVVRQVDEKALREYSGVYRWGAEAFVYLQLWNEFSGFSNPGPGNPFG